MSWFAFLWIVAMLVGACGEPAPTVPAHGGLALYVDGKLAWEENTESLARRPTDYARGGLRGWQVFGGMVPWDQAPQVTRIEAVAADGQRLVIDQPRRKHPGFEPVVFFDREQKLRFMMVSRAEQAAHPHGRGPGDGRGGGDRGGARGPLALEDVRALWVTRGEPGPATARSEGGDVGSRGNVAPPAGEPEGRGEFVLVVGGRDEQVRATELKAKMGGVDIWPLRAVVGARTSAPVLRITIRGRPEDEPVVIDRTAWEGGGRLDLRLNRRGFVKFESDTDEARDVSRIEVESGDARAGSG